MNIRFYWARSAFSNGKVVLAELAGNDPRKDAPALTRAMEAYGSRPATVDTAATVEDAVQVRERLERKLREWGEDNGVLVTFVPGLTNTLARV